MTDISEPALEKAIAKAKEQAPGAVGKVETSKVDVSKEADVQAAVEKLDAWGGLDVIFNNAGIMHGDDAGTYSRSLTAGTVTDVFQMPSRPLRRYGI